MEEQAPKDVIMKTRQALQDIAIRCRQNGTLWVDPDFPPTTTSIVGEGEKAPRSAPFVYDWKRGAEWVEVRPNNNPVLFSGDLQVIWGQHTHHQLTTNILLL